MVTTDPAVDRGFLVARLRDLDTALTRRECSGDSARGRYLTALLLVLAVGAVAIIGSVLLDPEHLAHLLDGTELSVALGTSLVVFCGLARMAFLTLCAALLIGWSLGLRRACRREVAMDKARAEARVKAAISDITENHPSFMASCRTVEALYKRAVVRDLIRSLSPSTVGKPESKVASGDASYNTFAITGLVLGLASVFFYVIVVIPILGIVFSTIGLATSNGDAQRNRWMAVVGLVLSVIFTLMFYFYLPNHRL